jgi:hypothetical protein
MKTLAHEDEIVELSCFRRKHEFFTLKEMPLAMKPSDITVVDALNDVLPALAAVSPYTRIVLAAPAGP